MGELLVPRFPVGEPVGQKCPRPGSPAVSVGSVPLPRGGGASSARRGWSHSARAWWLLWAGCPGIGVTRLGVLQALPGGLEAAWELELAALGQATGWSAALLAQVEAYRRHQGPAPLRSGGRLRPGGAPVLVPGDPAWPPALRSLARPPLALHWQGQGRLWPQLARRQAVAVVGTRHPSLHGRTMARRLGQVLARAGWPVVSGLAEGIDAAVHQGCLEGSGAPVAVLGTPLHRVYPRHHRDLQQAVGEAGLLISESPPGAKVLPGHFAARNRLQVALARALVLVECPENSGALHSASIAWELGLPLWVVPADAGKASALGSNRLLARGATPLLDPHDLLAALGRGPLVAHQGPGPAPPQPPRSVGSGPAITEPAVLRAVGGGASLEQLCLRLHQSPSDLMEPLLRLELAGVLRAEAGLCWSPASPGPHCAE